MKDIIGVTGFSVYRFGEGRQIELGTSKGETFVFSIGSNLVRELVKYLQNPHNRPGEEIVVSR